MPAERTSTKKKKFRLIVVEDEQRIARGLSKLKERLETRFEKKLEPNLQEIVIDVINVVKKEDFADLEHLPDDMYIVDLHLKGDGGKTPGGFEVLDTISTYKDRKFHSIVYTAHDSESNKQKCISLGVLPENIISKGSLPSDLNKLEQLIYTDFNEYLADPKEFTKFQQNISSTAQQNLPPQPEPDKTPDNQAVTENIAAEQENILKDSDVDEYSTESQKPNYVPMNIEAQYISVYSDVHRIYEKMSQNAKIALCKFFLEPFHTGYNAFGIEGKVFELNMDKRQGDPDSHRKIKFHIHYLINRNNRQLETLAWNFGEKEQAVNFSTLQAIKAHFSNHHNLLDKAPEFIIDLIELFAAQRLAQLYLNSTKTEQDKIIDQAAQLDTGMGGLSFITAIWEHITQEVTEDAEDTIHILKDLKKKGFPEIEEVFYCKITEVDEEDGVVDTEIFSLEDIGDVFPRSFDLKLLADAGLTNVAACFKLLILSNQPNRKHAGGRTYFIEPLPLSDYKRKQS